MELLAPPTTCPSRDGTTYPPVIITVLLIPIATVHRKLETGSDLGYNCHCNFFLNIKNKKIDERKDP
jgi:hypothetical protein